MTIDIIDLSDPKYAELSPVQLAMVREAQRRKDERTGEYEREREQIIASFVDRNLGTSSQLVAYVNTAYKAMLDEVEEIREQLEYQLAYEALGTEGNENGPYRYPENPNYGLSPAQRFIVVRNYYMSAVGDSKVRYEALRGDTLARAYLGDFYPTLLDLFASQA